ncbi:MAG: SDR family oxidoreductase [Burkholderiales bacterium]|nr:SDR family oxidoreductase [Burkholderiales bacterium]
MRKRGLSPSPRHHALIAGVTGVVGNALARHLAGRDDWTVAGCARRVPSDAISYPVIAMDLMNARDCREKIRALSAVTHLLYCARAPHGFEAKEPIDANLAMLRNLIDALESIAPNLAHVHIVQGSKVYGSDLGPYKTPAKETDPRVVDYNWYYAQEDLLADRSRGKAWTWSASRPHGVSDRGACVARSIAAIVGTYAAIAKELGQPLDFPGSAAGYEAIYQCVDAELLAHAIAWITTQPQCAAQAFNVTNGDFVRWKNLWPEFAAYFDLPLGSVKPTRLAEAMADKGPLWDRVVRKHALLPLGLADAATWAYGDFNFSRGYDVMSCTLRLRQAGFGECFDSTTMFLEQMAVLRRSRRIP